MSNWLDHWWPYVVAAFGVFYAGWRGLRKILRVADIIIGYEDAAGHHPGVGERLTAVEAGQDRQTAATDQLTQRVQELERLMSIHLSTAHYVDPEEDTT